MGAGIWRATMSIDAILTGAIIASILAIAGCSNPEPPKPRDPIVVESKRSVPAQAPEIADNPWTITEECHFRDDTAYGGWRKIYRFKHADGTELIGITGVGTSVVGSHPVGKTTAKDER